MVRDVVQDRDGTTHTRYERTLGGLPVLGGDLVVKASPAGATEGVSKASKATSAQLKAVGLTADVAPAAAEKQALGAAKAEGSKAKKASEAPRKVVWLGSGSPQLAYETVVGGLQHDGTRTSCTSSPTPPPARSSTSGRPSTTARATRSTTARSPWAPRPRTP